MGARRLLTAALAGASFASIVAQSASAYPSWVGDWLIEPVTGGETDFCLASGSYRSGHDLWFMVSEYGFSLAISNSKWSLPVGNSYGMDLHVDGRLIESAEAYVPTETVVRVDLEWNYEAIQALRRGYLLEASYSNGQFDFELEGTSAAISENFNCYYSEIQRQSSKNPFENAANSSNPFASTQGVSGGQTEILVSTRDVEEWMYDLDSTVTVVMAKDYDRYDIFGTLVSGGYFEVESDYYDNLQSAATVAASYLGEACGRYGVEPIYLGEDTRVVGRRIICEDEAMNLIAIYSGSVIGILFYNGISEEEILPHDQLLLVSNAIGP